MSSSDLRDRSRSGAGWVRRGACLLGLISAALLAGTAASAAEGEAEDFWDALTGGKPTLDIRARVEIADGAPGNVIPVAGIPRMAPDYWTRAQAYTVRTRLGYGTKPWYGVSVYADFENVAALWPSKYYNGVDPLVPIPAGLAFAGTTIQRTTVADPTVTEVNQAYLKIARKDWLDTTLIGGRQRIVLDDHRFIGNVGWRQNEQTYDAGLVQSALGVEDLQVLYSYIAYVRRIVGNQDNRLIPGVATPRAYGSTFDWESNSHIINASYGGIKYVKPTAFVYLLEFDNPANARIVPGVGVSQSAARLSSSASFGLRLTGDVELSDDVNLGYKLSYAYQRDYRGNPYRYNAHYYLIDVQAGYKPLGALGVGYEEIGSDGGEDNFQTPLATLHAMNGWADVFLNNGGIYGLRDLFVYVAPKLPWQLGSKIVWHHFTADYGGRGYGNEIDALIQRSFGKYLTLMAKGSYFIAADDSVTVAWANRNPPPLPPTIPGKNFTYLRDVYKVWLQAELKF